MKIQWKLMCLALSLQAQAMAWAAEEESCCENDNCSFSIQGDVSYFRPTASILREIYGSAWVDYKVALEHPLSCSDSFWNSLSIFADVSYLAKSGHTSVGHHKTHIQIIPVSLGLKWVQPISDSVNFYLGAAPRYYFLHIHNRYNFVKKNINKNGLGGVVITGFTYNFWEGLYLDLFASYSFKRFNKPSTPTNVVGHSLEVGGLDIGGGLGWKF